MVKISWRNPNTYMVLLMDAAIFALAYWLSYWLRFESATDPIWKFFPKSVAPVVAVKMVVFTLMGLQAGMWRYTGLVDLFNIVKASAASFAVIMAGTLYLYYPDLVGEFSRSVFIIDAILATGLIAMFRLSIRLYYTNYLGVKNSFQNSKVKSLDGIKDSGRIPALIYRADDRGELLLRSILGGGPLSGRYKVAGLLDDISTHRGASIHGKRILGSLDELERIVDDLSIKELLVASRIESENLESLHSRCRKLKITLRAVPGYIEPKDESKIAAALRKIEITDLLSREPVKLDTKKIEDSIKGKRVLVTGAGGSIGGELVRQISRYKPEEIILIEKSENYLFEIETNLLRESDAKVRFICLDITNKASMIRIFEEHKPEMIFHAAAHKHVPMMERNRDEAIRNNIGGMKVVADLAVEYNASRFVLISTDKAVEPSNVMGATKRVCELYAQALAHRNVDVSFMSVRFGNVLGSNGSVVPLFLRQIEEGGPVTVTSRDVTRYFMTIPEAVSLILEAATLGKQGDIFMLDMGAPVNIDEMAKKMIQLAGYEPGEEIEIKYSGLRQGEKVHEKLLGDKENKTGTAHPKVYKLIHEGMPWGGVNEVVDSLLSDLPNDPDKAVAKLMSMFSSDTIDPNHQ